jgi:hypothetical protein
MFSATKAMTLAAAAAVAIAAGTGAALAAKKWRETDGCFPAVEGSATATGIFGQGSAKARVAARINWEKAAADTYGPEYASLGLARRVQWDCKRGAVLRAKCVVTAEPCGARIRG